jgi:glycosyltransferase involved in cell wall biosynthesis
MGDEPASRPALSTGRGMHIALLTGGHDRSYALGLTRALTGLGIRVDVIGSDNVDDPGFRKDPLVDFRNLRGDQREDAPLSAKALRLLRYYARLLAYAASAKPRVFHVLWNNKVEWLDRTLLMVWYRLCRRKVVLTAHNVNAARRDGKDSRLNRATLRIQYRLASHVFVHTVRMADELASEFAVIRSKISVIPFGINDTLPSSALTRIAARESFGLGERDVVALFFGQIAPYKGLEYLLEAVPRIAKLVPSFRLLVAGRIKEGSDDYGARIRAMLAAEEVRTRTHGVLEHIEDADVEKFFKAADVLVLPYIQIFQSGVPFLAYNFGLPVIATDVGSLRDDVVDGQTGFICQPRDSGSIAAAVALFAASDLCPSSPALRESIKAWACARYSWARVATITRDVYDRVDGAAPSAPVR